MASLEIGHVYVVKTTLTKPPKEKIVICICNVDNLFFWFNTKSQHHGIGQLPCCADDHSALSHDCFLDISRVTTFLPAEIEAAQDRGALSAEFKQKVQTLLSDGIATLAPKFLDLAKRNLL